MKSRTRWAAAGGLLGAAMLLSACASGGTSSPAPAAASGAAAPTGGSGSVMLGTTTAGKVLVDPHGMTLYAFAKDTKGHSTCTGQCAAYWPPVPSRDAPKANHGAITATFGAVKRTDGSSQLTVNGFPMYTYAGDSRPGQATGQGQNLSGGLWWVVSGNGSWVTH